MNRIIVVALLFVTVFGLGCGEKEPPPEKSSPTAEKTDEKKSSVEKKPVPKKPVKLPLDQRLYGGFKHKDWPSRISNLAPDSSTAIEAVPGMLALVADEEVPANTRQQAAFKLGHIGAPAVKAVPIFVSLLQKHASSEKPDDNLICMWSIRSLSFLGPVAKAATPELAKIVTDSTKPIPMRGGCMEALGKIGAADAKAVSTISKMLTFRFDRNIGRTNENLLRGYAIDSVALVGPSAAPFAMRSLIKLSRHRNDDIRRKSAYALGSMKQQGRDAVAPLADLLIDDDSPAVRDAAADGLASLGELALPFLVKKLTAEEPADRARAASSLGKMKLLNKSATDALTKMALDPLDNALDDDDGWVRINAIESLWIITGKPDAVVFALVEELKNPNRRIRFKAYQLFQKIGAEAKSAIGPLKKLLTHEQGFVRSAAAKALRTIETAR